MIPTVHLRPGHVQPVWAGHPWVYAQAIDRLEGRAEPGDEVRVVDPRGNPLGRGFWSPGSAIPVRILSRDASVAVDDAFLSRRVAEAVAWRRALLELPNADTTGLRLVNSEGDGLPGLIVDAFGDDLVVQLLTAGIKRREGAILDALVSATGAARVWETSSAHHQKLEGITARDGIVRGEATDAIRFTENGVALRVAPPGAGADTQKTGYYFDQRDNRARVARMCKGRKVLDAFAFVGGFALAAAKAGAAEVLAVESGAAAAAAGEANTRENAMESVVRWRRADAKKVFVELAAQGERFDVVVIDPPKLAHNARELRDALGHYRKLNGLAAALVAPGGVLVSCSCSGAVSVDDLLRAIALGARDANREHFVLDVHGAAADHPVPVAFPDGRYLKCVFGRVA
jgi:23S rRNA (cytosine1962-C5)-methyltransferase